MKEGVLTVFLFLVDGLRSSFSERLDYLNERVPENFGKYLIVVLLLGFPAVYFTKYTLAFLLMIVTVAFSVLTSQFNLNKLGLETATFSTVVMSVVFGPEKGAVLAGVYIALQLFSGNPPGVYILWVLPSYILAGYLAGIFSGLGIVTLGMAVAIGLQSFFSLITAVLEPDRLPSYIQYALFNVVFNFMLFKSLGKVLVKIAFL